MKYIQVHIFSPPKNARALMHLPWPTVISGPNLHLCAYFQISWVRVHTPVHYLSSLHQMTGSITSTADAGGNDIF